VIVAASTRRLRLIPVPPPGPTYWVTTGHPMADGAMCSWRDGRARCRRPTRLRYPGDDGQPSLCVEHAREHRDHGGTAPSGQGTPPPTPPREAGTEARSSASPSTPVCRGRGCDRLGPRHAAPVATRPASCPRRRASRPSSTPPSPTSPTQGPPIRSPGVRVRRDPLRRPRPRPRAPGGQGSVVRNAAAVRTPAADPRRHRRGQEGGLDDRPAVRTRLEHDHEHNDPPRPNE
jgi:hypothetical protein